MTPRPGIASIRLAVAVLVVCPAVRAADFFVTNVSQFNAAVPLAQAGDTITLATGTWTNADLVFWGKGTADSPITLRAQVDGAVFLTGSSRLHLSGSHLIAQGLVFTNGFPHALDTIEFQAASYGLATNCEVTDCAIVNFNPPAISTDTKWVSLYGFSNRVDHCSFLGKSNAGTLLIVWLPRAAAPSATTPNYHLIDYNYFGLRPPLGANGAEIIRVGDSSTSMDISRTVVEHNYFLGCDGEIEIVSNKSCENTYRYNTFVECAGTLTLRHGNRNWVEGNFFFGNHKASTGGVRIIAEDQTVLNNYFQDLTGSAGYSALTLMQGLTNSPLDGYFQVKNANVAFNTLVNCSHSLVVGLASTYSGYGTNVTTSLPPLNCTIANNIVLTSQNQLVDQRLTPVNPTWEGNVMFGTTLGIGPTPGILLADPKLGLGSDNLWRPGAGSPALGGAQGAYGFVTQDIRGRLRPATKDVGSDQASSSPVLREPLTAADVGPSWLHKLGVKVGLSSGRAVLMRWICVPGAGYQVQCSPDLVNWSNAGNPVAAGGKAQSWEELLAPTPELLTPAKFYRVKQISGAASPQYAATLALTNLPCVLLRWNCVPGNRYQVQMSTNFVTWQDISPVITNTATAQSWQELLTPALPPAVPAKYYRVKQLAESAVNP